MKHLSYISYCIGSVIATVLCTACSTQKNTGASRTWHQLKTVHNVYFNGRLSYDEGMTALDEAHSDNYATLLPLYPVSDHDAAQSAASTFDKSIEKSRKCIKLHSIHARPKVNARKAKKPAYQNWLKSKEFNNQMYRAWFMLAQSEFHKGEFLESVGTFRYIERLYDNDPDIQAQCQLWVARAYGEMGWIYEAEDILQKVQVDNLNRRHKNFFSAVNADVLLKGQHHAEAIPFVRVAKKDEKRKQYLPRFEFVLGQLYRENNQPGLARAAFKRVYKMHPKDVQMEFNARLMYAELDGDTLSTVKRLNRMARLYKYRDQLDQLYGTIGNIYLANGDTVRALSYYEKGIESATQDGDAKVGVLITAGDLYYGRHDYPQALPCYKQATAIISSTHEAYDRVLHRSEVLDEVVVDIQTVQLQDSLQHLGTLTEEEQRQIVERIIAELIEAEKQDSIRAAEKARENELLADGGGLQSVNTSRMLGNRIGEDANWYFYNPQLMKTGKQEFMRKWGQRTLEDNWRRLSKTIVTSSDWNNDYEMDGTADSTKMSSDSLSTPSIGTPSTDIHNPEYYLQQIPRTPQDYALSDSLIADALHNLIYLYRDRVEDRPMSDLALADYRKRFPNDSRMLDVLYDQYLDALRTNDEERAKNFRQLILQQFPNSTQAQIVSDPNYFAALQRMAAEQDSLYEDTYDAYRAARYAQVQTNCEYATSSYPLSPIMPRMLFLNAVATAKKDGQQAFQQALNDMVTRYPEHELSAMAKDMLALMGQGRESQQGGSTSSLQEQREQVLTPVEEEPTTQQWSTETREPSLVYIVIKANEEDLNEMLYQVALFNFSQFLIKDFDLQKIVIFSPEQSALQIEGLESLDEAQWYIDMMQNNESLKHLFQRTEAIIFPIISSNLPFILTPANPYL